MKRYLIKVISDNKGSIYEDEKAVSILMFVTAKNKYRAAYKAAIEIEYLQMYNEYEGVYWNIEKTDKNKYIATNLEMMPTFYMEFLPVEENTEVISIIEKE